MDKALLQRVKARIVQPEWAERVVSPAYDVLRPFEREKLMEQDPYVFLHVTSAKGTESRETRTDANAAALERLYEAGAYSAIAEPSLYLYKLVLNGHEQIAVVGDVSLEIFEAGRIIPHERTRQTRADDLANHLEKIGVHSSPVALAYDDDESVKSLISEVLETAPILDFCREDNLEQTIWQIPDEISEKLIVLFQDKDTFIIDGHHRMSASKELWTRLGRSDQYSRVLAAFFAVGDLNMRAFHRRVVDLNGLTSEKLTSQIAENDFVIRPLNSDENAEPVASGYFSMFLDGQWNTLEPLRVHPSEFDAAILQNRILGPILNVDEGGSDERLQYLPGTVGLSHLESITLAEGGVSFALHPVNMKQLLSVIKNNKTLPPKSTYFEPKVRSGIFIVER